MRATYDDRGHVTVRAVLDEATLAAARAHLETLPGEALRAAPLTDPVLARLSADPRLVAVAAEVLGGPVEPFAATYVVKPPGVGLPALWHQDGHPWQERLGGAAALTVWVALDPATPDNGCLRVVPGSHRLPLHPLVPNEEVPSLFGVELDPALVDEAAAEDVVLAAGDVSVHHPNLVHGSGPNRSARPRRALAVRYRCRNAPESSSASNAGSTGSPTAQR
jgi:ectoine hydroxylase-related dioxygenase (phytanoyl-CoA dioxygenase family)